jgi:hypothetical protein
MNKILLRIDSQESLITVAVFSAGMAMFAIPWAMTVLFREGRMA